MGQYHEFYVTVNHVHAKPEQDQPRAGAYVILHPAREGNILNQRYTINRRLGAGYGIRSTIWLSKDSVYIPLLCMASSSSLMKILELEMTSSLKSLKVGQALRSTEQQHVIRMLDYFSLDSSFDLKLDNLLLRVEDTTDVPLLGDSDSPIDLSRVSLGPSAVVISDLGVASHVERPFHGVIQPFALRALEVYLGIPYDPSADIRNLGCLAFELVTSCWLFYLEAMDRWSRDDDILGLMVSVNGLTSFPVDVLARGKFSSKYFDKSGNLLEYTVGSCTLEQMLELRFRSQPEDDRKLLADMLSRMLRLRPEDRESARELLNHPWLRDS
ncbi:kinase-like domain-containing protein [Armillaria mellea]|nr:kinase-like domain-containing protein [Armillaria mellea]